MTDKPSNPRAFPSETRDLEGDFNKGMTLRDYFAAKAMQALLAGATGTISDKELAQHAYIAADAMLKERSET